PVPGGAAGPPVAAAAALAQRGLLRAVGPPPPLSKEKRKYSPHHQLTPKRLARKGGQGWSCHSYDLQTNRKIFIVLIYKREELTHLILKLLQAWKESLSHFNQHIEHHQELSDDSLSKAKQVSNMVHELKTGVEKVTEKMQSTGIISNSLNGMASSEAAGLSISNEANLMSESDFIHCFRRDSNKVQSYLKILKCRIMPENSR
uniref:Prolactin n=1 Tax=Apteryx owenii TaxID=8824 RepID=A0A8B9Q7H5_APTOW